jgi:hypothetical protein
MNGAANASHSPSKAKADEDEVDIEFVATVCCELDSHCSMGDADTAAAATAGNGESGRGDRGLWCGLVRLLPLGELAVATDESNIRQALAALACDGFDKASQNAVMSASSL